MTHAFGPSYEGGSLVEESWVELTLGSKLEYGSAGNLSARFSASTGDVRLRGTAKVKAGKTLETADEHFKLPESGYTPTTVYSYMPLMTEEEVQLLEIVTAEKKGQYAGGKSLEAGTQIYFDGITWSTL